MTLVSAHRRSANNKVMIVSLVLALADSLHAAPNEPAAQAIDEHTQVHQQNGHEQLRSPPLSEWRETDPIAQGEYRVRQWFDARNDKLSLRIESFRQEPMPTPDALLTFAIAARRHACRELNDSLVSKKPENGYPTQIALLECKSEKDRESTPLEMLKAIKGDEWLYVISLQQREPGTNDSNKVRIRQWAPLLRSIVLCNDTPEHPCPPASP